ncbi:MAG: hypothetical protein GC152_14670 [Alphaproteobacteria bacterium]|nr:hypothetical protein [Alphaproteobacteria bacterium]
MLLTGAIEATSGAALLVPTAITRRSGALLLILTMLGATGFHLVHDHPSASAPALLLLGLSAFVFVSPTDEIRRRHV